MIEISKEEKRAMKSFKLDNKIDFIVYLQEIIARTDKCIVKQKKYLDRLKIYIDVSINENVGKLKKEIIVKYDEYSEYLDLLSGVESYVLNLVGDHQNNSISYNKFRTIISKRKKNGKLGFKIRNLDEKISFLLEDLNKLRNWQNHVPESLLSSEIKLIKEGELLDSTQNPIIINYYNYCTLEYVEAFYKSSYSLYEVIRMVHQSMKKDYSDIIGESVKVNRKYSDTPVGIERLKATKISADVQAIKGLID